MALLKKDMEVLKQLGFKYMNFATLPVQMERLRLWKSLNRSKMERPMVCIDQLPWNELNVNHELTLQIEDPYWRTIEWNLRTQIYKWTYFPVDMVLEPYITVPRVIHNSGYGIIAEVKSLELVEGTTAVSQSYTNLLKDYEDIAKIEDMQITVDEPLSNQYLQQAREIFAGVAPVILGRGIQFHLGIWDHITQLMSVEDAYYGIVDDPELIHACMDRITDATISGIKQANEQKIHDDILNTCHCSYIYIQTNCFLALGRVKVLFQAIVGHLVWLSYLLLYPLRLLKNLNFLIFHVWQNILE